LSLWHCVAYVVLICRQETLKPDTHYPFERPVRTSSVYRALLAHSVIMAMPTGFTAYRACQGLTLSVGLRGLSQSGIGGIGRRVPCPLARGLDAYFGAISTLQPFWWTYNRRQIL